MRASKEAKVNTESSLSWRGLSLICLCVLICAGALFIVQETVARSVTTTIHVNSKDGSTGGPDCRLRDAISAANTAAFVGGCDGSGGGPYIIELIDPGQGSVYEFSVIDNNSNALDYEAYYLLGLIARFVAQEPATALVLRGYTDRSGVRAYNLKLAEFRANTVKTYLVGKGIPADSITIIAVGPDPNGPGNTTVPYDGQRRKVIIEFIRPAS